MPAGTGEPGAGIDLEKIRELEERLDNFRISVDTSITVQGSAWQGYAINTPSCNEIPESQGGGGGHPPVPGACCLPNGTCETVTPGQCLLDGGTFVGGSCFPNPCGGPPPGTGACCTDGECSITTEEDCGGTYQGDDTTCEDVDCTQGACCFDETCSLYPNEASCTGDGGDWQGEGSTCDEGTCPCACPFLAFDGSGRRFRHYSLSITGFISNTTDRSACSPHEGTTDAEADVTASCEISTNLDCTQSPDGTWSSNFVVTNDGIVINEGHSSGTDCPPPDLLAFLETFACSNCPDCSGPPAPSVMTTATTRDTTVDFSDSGTNSTFCPPASITCSVSGTYTSTETLSDECEGFSPPP